MGWAGGGMEMAVSLKASFDVKCMQMAARLVMPTYFAMPKLLAIVSSLQSQVVCNRK